MDTPSVETDDPPGQEPLMTWPAFAGRIALEPDEEHAAKLWFYPDGGPRESFGEVEFEPARNQFVVRWTAAGRMHIGRSQVDTMNSDINYAMAERMR